MAELTLNPLPPTDGAMLRPAGPDPATTRSAGVGRHGGPAPERPAFPALLLALGPPVAGASPPLPGSPEDPGAAPPLPPLSAGLTGTWPGGTGDPFSTGGPEAAAEPAPPDDPATGQSLPATGNPLPLPVLAPPAAILAAAPGAPPLAGDSGGEGPATDPGVGQPGPESPDGAAPAASRPSALPDLELVRGAGIRDRPATPLSLAMANPSAEAGDGDTAPGAETDADARPGSRGSADGEPLRLPAQPQAPGPVRDLAELLRNFRPQGSPSAEGTVPNPTGPGWRAGSQGLITLGAPAGGPGGLSAAPATFPALAPLGPAEAWAGGLADRMLMLAADGNHTARLTLYPEHLGTLEVRIRVEDGAAQVWFNSPHAQAREALEAALPRLRELFADQGMQLVRAEVGAGGSQRGGPGDGGRDRGPWADEPAARAPAPVGLAPADRPVLAALLGARPAGNRLIDLWA